MTTPGGYSAGTIFLTVVPSFKGFQKRVRAEARAANKVMEEELKSTSKDYSAGSVDKRQAEKRGRESGKSFSGAFRNTLDKSMADMLKALPDVPLKADADPIRKTMLLIRKEIEGIRGEVRLGVRGDVEAARRISELRQELKKFALGKYEADINIDAGTAFAKAAAIDQLLNRVDGRKVKARVDIDGIPAARRGIHQMLRDIDQNGNALRAFNGRVLLAAAALPLLGVAAMTAAGAIGVLSVAAVGALAGLGIMVAAFSGIGDATKALGDVQKNAAKDSLAASKTMRNAGKAVRDAEQGVARAREDAAQSAESASQQVRDSLRAQERAEDDLRDAQRGALRAQERLTDARKDAQDQIEDLALSVRGGALAERQAVIDLFEAEVSYRNAMNDGGATNKDREEAAIQLEQQRLRLEEIRLENGRLAEQQAEVARTGIEGTEGVISAREGLAQANERVAEADLGRIDAARDVQEAYRQQAQVAADGQRQIRDAQERLNDSQDAYREALEQTSVQGSASMLALKDAMSQLGPAGQAFAIFLNGSVLPFLKEIRSVIQEAMLPGVTLFLQTLMQYAPQISAFLGIMAGVLGDLFAKFAEVLTTSPAWADFFAMLTERGPTLLQLLGEVGIVLLTIFAQLLTAFAPLAEEFLTWLLEVTTAFSDWLQTPEGQKEMQEFLGYIREIAPIVLEFLVWLVKAMVNLGKALAPYAEMLLKALTGFVEFIAGMDPSTLAAITVALIVLTITVQTILGLVSLFTTVATAYMAVAGTAIGAALGAAAAAALPVIAVIGAVIGIFIILWLTSETFRDIVKAVMRAAWGAVKAAFEGILWLWENVLKPVFNAIWETAKWLWSVISVIFKIIVAAFAFAFDSIALYWDKFVNSPFGQKVIGFFEMIGDALGAVWDIIAKDVSQLWTDITDLFKGGVRLAVKVINEGIVDPINWLARAVGVSDQVDRIPMPFEDAPRGRSGDDNRQALGFARGGWTGPGSKYQEAGIVHADEFVVRKESQRKLRREAPGFLDYLNRFGEIPLPGYAGGGLVAFGRELQRRGFRVGEHPAFGGVNGRHAPGSEHYKGNAIDVNYGPGGESDIEKRAIDAIVGMAKEHGLRTIWRTAGHFGHVHFDGGAGGDIMGSIAGALSSAAGVVGSAFGKIKDAAGKIVGEPLDYVMGKARALYGDLTETTFGKVAIGGIERGVRQAADWLMDKVKGVGDFLTPDFVYDQSSASVRDVVRNTAAGRGWGSGPEWDALQTLIQKESSFNPTAQNPTSTAYGLFQFLNGTWAGTGFAKSSDPAVQTAAGLRYIEQRYGTPTAALAFHRRNNWYADGGRVGEDGVHVPDTTLYDSGGWLQPGITTVLNASGRPEPVFTAAEFDRLVAGGGDGGEEHWHYHDEAGVGAEGFAEAVQFKKRVAQRGGKHAGVNA